MPRVRVIHWRASEAAELIETLRSSGYEVEYDEKFDSSFSRKLKNSPPDALVIDLSRLPSHGREVAVFLRGQKATRQIPIVFVNGEPEKVERVRATLPDAVFTTPGRLIAAVRRAIEKPLASPVRPEQMMERYAKRTAAQKLGIREGAKILLIDPPADYLAAIGEIPEGAEFEEDSREVCDVTLWFTHDPAGLQSGLPAMRKIAGRTKLWILWRKQSARKGSGMSETLIRESAIALGLVDYKVCSVNQVWSGLLFTRKKE